MPAEIYHLKAAGKPNWAKMDAGDREDRGGAGGRPHDHRRHVHLHRGRDGPRRRDAALGAGGRPRRPGSKRLKDPAIRARCARRCDARRDDWENLFLAAGSPDKILLVGFKNDTLKPLTGKTLAEVAKMRGKSPEETAMDLVIEDGSRVGTVYFLMSEDNVRKQIALPWVSFGSDAESPAPEGVFLKSSRTRAPTATSRACSASTCATRKSSRWRRPCAG